jgi:hypothetical protein
MGFTWTGDSSCPILCASCVANDLQIQQFLQQHLKTFNTNHYYMTNKSSDFKRLLHSQNKED